MAYTWQELTPTAIANLYLFGKINRPADLVSNELIRPAEAKTIIEVDAVSFMVSGPGRFASASRAPVVGAFFDSNLQILQGNGVRREFTRDQMVSLLGAEAKFTYQQTTYGGSDLGSRTFIWNSSSFTLSSGTKFIIEADGTRTIENLSVLPFDDNYDFKSNSNWTMVGNALLEPWIDPSGIGREVKLIMVNKDNVPATSTYDVNDFAVDKAKADLASNNSPSLPTVYSEISSIVDDLWNGGSTKYLFDNKPIVYGTTEGDSLNQGKVTGHYYLGSYVANGVVMIGASGDDFIQDTVGADIMIGGADFDSADFGGSGGLEMTAEVITKELEGRQQKGLNLDIAGRNGPDALFQMERVTLGTAADTIKLKGELSSFSELPSLEIRDSGVGSAAKDTLDFSGVTGGGVNIKGNNTLLFGGLKFTNFEKFVLTQQADTFSANGSTIAVEVDGGDGNDKLEGGRARDILVGGGGKDELRGWEGSDSLTGGTGADRFFVGARDHVLDSSADDKIFIDDSQVRSLKIESVFKEWGSFPNEGTLPGYNVFYYGYIDGDAKSSWSGHPSSPIYINSGGTLYSFLSDGQVIAFQNYNVGDFGLEAASGMSFVSKAYENFNQNYSSGSIQYFIRFEPYLRYLAQAKMFDAQFAANQEPGEFLVLSGAMKKFNSQMFGVDSSDQESNPQSRVYESDQLQSDSLLAATAMPGDIITGSSGFDLLEGTSGDDQIRGGGGVDLLMGADGSDEYVYGYSDEAYYIMESVEDADSADTLSLVDYDPADVDIVIDGSNLVIQVFAFDEYGNQNYDSDRSIIVFDQFTIPVTGAGIERIVFKNGTIWTRAQIEAHVGFDDGSGNGQPTDIVLDAAPIDEHTLGSTFVGTISGIDPDGSAGLTYRLLDSANDRFFLSGTSLYARGGPQNFDYEENASVTVSIRVTDQFGLSFDRQFTIEIADKADLNGASGNDSLVGSSLDDIILGYGGDDVVAGGEGNDLMMGGSGSDTYVLGTESGQDTIFEAQDSSSIDRVIFASGIAPSDIVVDRDGLNAKISWGADDYILIVDQFDAGNSRVERFEFEDGTVWDMSDLKTNYLSRNNTSGSDSVGGFAGDDVISTGAGDDEIYGDAGNDVLSGGTGDDSIYGEDGDDVIDGGEGNDQQEGGRGFDTFIFNSGFGHDTIVDFGYGEASDDVIQFDSSLFANFTSVLAASEQVGADTVITASDGNTLTLLGVQRDKLHADDFLFLADDENGDATIIGTSAGETVLGTAIEDIIFAKAGDDVITGGAGGDVYIYRSGDGSDTIADGAGYTNNVDVLRFTDLNAVDLSLTRAGDALKISIIPTGEVITVDLQFYSTEENWGIERFDFADGSSWDLATINANAVVDPTADATVIGTSAGETVLGTAIEDIIFAKEGDDVITGGAGGDVYIYRSTDGSDTIADEAGYTNNIDVLRFTDLNSADLALTRAGDALKISIVPTGEVITVELQFFSTEENWGIERFDFADGTSWDLATINANAVVDPTGDATVIGTSAGETVLGTAIEDIIFAKEGDDVITGGAGGDIYIYRSTDGSDTIADEAGYTNNVDVLRFTDLNATDLSLTRVDETLKIAIISTGEVITVERQFYSTEENWGIERFDFADGTSWDLATINANAVVDPTGDATIVGTSAGETIAGTGVEDIIFGKEGDDFITGSAGGDVYIYRSGDGSDTIDDLAGYTNNVDVLRFTDLNAADISLVRDGDKLEVTVTSTGEVITVDHQFYSTTENWGIERFDFADGTSWDFATINANAVVDPNGAPTVVGTSGNDILVGSTGVDVILGDTGDDEITGGTGSDVFVFASGFGKDIITDFVAGSATDDVIEFDDADFADLSAVLAAASQVGSDTVITYDANNTVTLKNVTLGNLHSDDFRFV